MFEHFLTRINSHLVTFGRELRQTGLWKSNGTIVCSNKSAPSEDMILTSLTSGYSCQGS
jgi:hypothetical protein